MRCCRCTGLPWPRCSGWWTRSPPRWPRSAEGRGRGAVSARCAVQTGSLVCSGLGWQAPLHPVVAKDLHRVLCAVRSVAAGQLVAGAVAVTAPAGALGMGGVDGESLGHGKEIPRSEEHTSELQSQSNLVCRLLLAKKKKT